MADAVKPRNIFEIAIDGALVRHVEKLFDKFASDLEIELATNPEELRTSALPSARVKFEHKFDVAIMAHSEMIDVMRKKHDTNS